MRFNAVVKDGKAKVYHKSQMESWISSFEGKEIVIDITKAKIKKTVDQNSGLHKLIDFFTIALNELTGNEFSPAEVKEMIKLKKLQVNLYDKHTGRHIGEGLRSVADLGKEETSDLIEYIYRYAADEFKIILPDLIKLE